MAENSGINLKTQDGCEVYVHVFDKVNEPKGIVQIFHGMAEHGKRYTDFAKYLNNLGYVVYVDDHRGHGNTAKQVEALGYLGDDGFNRIVNDEHEITLLLKEKYPNLPIYIFGHSFGSFVAQEYLINYSNEIDGLILSGSAMQKGMLINFGTFIASLFYKFGDEKKQNKIIDNLSFGSYNKKIKNPSTKFDWLSRDTNQVQKYIDDEFCGTVFPTNFYYHLFKGFKNLYKTDRFNNTNKKLPIFIMSGDGDPVGGYGKTVINLYNFYKNIGFSSVDLTLYPEGRHEMLNETNKDEVYANISKFISEIEKR